MNKVMLTTDYDFSIDVRDVAIVGGVPRARDIEPAPREDWITDKIDSYYDRFDRMPDCETRRALLAHAEDGTLGATFRAMAEIEWERRS